MQINSLIDLLEMIQRPLEILGSEFPSYEMENRIDLYATMKVAVAGLDLDSQAVAADHLADFRKMIMEED
jgi:hypothetical protein